MNYLKHLFKSVESSKPIKDRMTPPRKVSPGLSSPHRNNLNKKKSTLLSPLPEKTNLFENFQKSSLPFPSTSLKSPKFKLPIQASETFDLPKNQAPSDFYFHPIDWSSQNLVAVALNTSIELFSDQKLIVQDLLSQIIISPVCLRFLTSSNEIAIGTIDGPIHIVDIERDSIIQTINFSSSSPLCIDRYDSTIVSSFPDGTFFFLDYRIPQ